MMHPSTVPLQEVVTFTYRASMFDLPEGRLGEGWRSLTPTARGRPSQWNLSGGRLWPPQGFQEQLDKT